ncbi:hypothetical protein [Lacinutrix sp. Bg11-31]|uniref:hypothetical protein n=1 Tax=Lacinutrix sp. Bg11-31 TaxID=2057808 RepID=UPI000C31226B|nr:hypothetical protein [Lacinutrix sp. Bg11-31]AUC81852.1 hypothetical protein CW733_06780 [Lacinutrix sp. Bg11-31]
MKKILKTVLLFCIAFTFSNCDNDDDTTTPNVDVCSYQGLTFLDVSSNTQTLIPETDLTTDYLTGGSNGPEIEVYETSNPGNFNFTTTVVDDNTTGISTINYNGNTYLNIATTCQRGVTGTTGAVVGDEFRFDISGNGVEIELCIIVDVLSLSYIDADGDGCGSQIISYSIGGVGNSLDTDDGDASICL